MEISFRILLLIFIVLILLDKGITTMNITQVNKNFPNSTKEDYFKIEKNPLAKWFFEKFGLFGGSVLYGIVSLITLFGSFYLFTWITNERIALWIIFIIMGAVIANNSYFLLKYSQIIN
jgi:hypothetical protein